MITGPGWRESASLRRSASATLERFWTPIRKHAPRFSGCYSRKTFARVYVGDGNSLELISIHVSVSVEGPRARTVVDHVFRNPHDKILEGTFEYPLPAGASPSYYAMFLGASRDSPPSS